MLGGGCGDAYGLPNWNFPANWRQVLEQPGALSLKHLRSLFELRPWWKLLPDARNVVAVGGLGAFATNNYTVTAVADGASFAIAYLPTRRMLTLDMAKLSGDTVKGWWFNPRNGEATVIGKFPNTGEREFTPPDLAEQLDWVLVLDNAAMNYPQAGEK